MKHDELKKLIIDIRNDMYSFLEHTEDCELRRPLGAKCTCGLFNLIKNMDKLYDEFTN